jgi:DUF4097 and DUF4098 domain-containing protein YvlB
MTEITPRELEIAGRVALDLTVPAGRIEVDAGDREQTVVTLSPLNDSASTLAAIEDATVEVRGRGDGARLVVQVKGRRHGSDTKVLIRVECPEACDLNVRTASADLQAHGRLGSVTVVTASGDVQLDEVDGSVAIKSASGSLNLATARGDLTMKSASGDISAGRLASGGKIRTASGDVLVRENTGSLSIHSASGDLQIDAVEAGKIVFHSASGDLVIGVRRGSTLQLDARSMSGSIDSEIELEDSPAGGSNGAPHVEVHAVSMSGDVRIRRA